VRTLSSDGLGRKRADKQRLEAIVVASPDALLLGRRLDLSARITIGRAEENTLAVKDDRMSRRHGVLEPADPPTSGVLVTDLGSRNGVQVDGAKARRALAGDGAIVRLGDTCLVVQTARPATAAPDESARVLVGRSPGLVRVRQEIAKVAPTDLAVLVLGETGTGKELVASEVHRLSGRGGELVAVNCAAVPEKLLESTLFGHTRGAFTGAAEKSDGLFVRADGGTLFLDEVGELPLAAQPKLLRVLEDGLVTPVGDGRPRAVDVRVVAATNTRLREEVEAGRFRADLFARLEAWPIELPPLRTRKVDVCTLLRHFIADRPPTADAVEALLIHDWPFNVRELRTLARRLEVSCAPGEPIRLDDTGPLADQLRARRDGTEPPIPAADCGLTRERIEAALRELNGNVTRAAKHLGCGRKTLYRRLTEYEIDPEGFR